MEQTLKLIGEQDKSNCYVVVKDNGNVVPTLAKDCLIKQRSWGVTLTNDVFAQSLAKPPYLIQSLAKKNTSLCITLAKDYIIYIYYIFIYIYIPCLIKQRLAKGDF